MKETLINLLIILILTISQSYVVIAKCRDEEYKNFSKISFSAKLYFLKSVLILVLCLYLTVFQFIKLIKLIN